MRLALASAATPGRAGSGLAAEVRVRVGLATAFQHRSNLRPAGAPQAGLPGHRDMGQREQSLRQPAWPPGQQLRPGFRLGQHSLGRPCLAKLSGRLALGSDADNLPVNRSRNLNRRNPGRRPSPRHRAPSLPTEGPIIGPFGRAPPPAGLAILLAPVSPDCHLQKLPRFILARLRSPRLNCAPP